MHAVCEMIWVVYLFVITVLMPDCIMATAFIAGVGPALGGGVCVWGMSDGLL